MSFVNEELDISLARVLQAQFDEEVKELHRSEIEVIASPKLPGTSHSSKCKNKFNEPEGEKLTVSLIDPCWEVLDPCPNIHDLFLIFNKQFFWTRLLGVEVKWSPRMTLCAGVCSYEGRGGLCSIRLSVPLLKLRPRKDLIETLLHEMIHAYLFVTCNNRDRDGHGPEFHSHMYRINKLAGTHISVYHSFHDEVSSYRQHIWQCNGPCKRRPPYYGLVKRSMNRAPSKSDYWWAKHQLSCGGQYTKIKSPDVLPKKSLMKSVSKGASRCKNIKSFFSPLQERNSNSADERFQASAVLSNNQPQNSARSNPYTAKMPLGKSKIKNSNGSKGKNPSISTYAKTITASTRDTNSKHPVACKGNEMGVSKELSTGYSSVFTGVGYKLGTGESINSHTTLKPSQLGSFNRKSIGGGSSLIDISSSSTNDKNTNASIDVTFDRDNNYSEFSICEHQTKKPSEIFDTKVKTSDSSIKSISPSRNKLIKNEKFSESVEKNGKGFNHVVGMNGKLRSTIIEKNRNLDNKSVELNGKCPTKNEFNASANTSSEGNLFPCPVCEQCFSYTRINQHVETHFNQECK